MDGSHYRERAELGRFRTSVTPEQRQHIAACAKLRRYVSSKAIANRLGLTLYQVERIASQEMNK